MDWCYTDDCKAVDYETGNIADIPNVKYGMAMTKPVVWGLANKLDFDMCVPYGKLDYQFTKFIKDITFCKSASASKQLVGVWRTNGVVHYKGENYTLLQYFKIVEKIQPEVYIRTHLRGGFIRIRFDAENAQVFIVKLKTLRK